MKYRRKEINREICAGIDNNTFSVFMSGAYLPAYGLMSMVDLAIHDGIFAAVEAVVADSFGITNEV